MRVLDVVEVLGVLDFPAPLHSVPRGGEGHTHGALYPNFLKVFVGFSTSRTILHAARTVKSQVERSEYNNQPSTASEANLQLRQRRFGTFPCSVSVRNVQTGVGPLFPALCEHWRFCPMCPMCLMCPITCPSLCPFCPCALREGAFAGVILSISTGRASGPSAYSGERLRSSISLAPSCATGQEIAF